MDNAFKNRTLKKILTKLFPGKKIMITNNKDGAQTISIL